MHNICTDISHGSGYEVEDVPVASKRNVVYVSNVYVYTLDKVGWV